MYSTIVLFMNDASNLGTQWSLGKSQINSSKLNTHLNELKAAITLVVKKKKNTS